jgi:penicillin-binding protein-related factor A (putative recombinase)
VDYIGSVGLRDKTFVTRFTPVAFDVKSSESGELDISLSEGGRGLQRHQYEYLRQHWEAFGGLSFVLLVHDDQSKGIRRCCFFAFETIKTLVEHGVKSVPFDETTALQNQSTGWDWLPALPKENP